MTFLPVPKQTSLFTAAWLSLLSYSLLAFTFLGPLSLLCLCPPLFGLSHLSHVHSSLSMMGDCMTGAWLVHGWRMHGE